MRGISFLNRTLGLRGDANKRLGRARTSHASKPTFPYLSKKRRGGEGGSRKKAERKCWFCFRRFTPPKRLVDTSYHFCQFYARFFSVACDGSRHFPSPRLVVALASAHTSQSPRIGRSHAFAMPARCLLRVRSVGLFGFVVILKKRIVPNCRMAQTD